MHTSLPTQQNRHWTLSVDSLSYTHTEAQTLLVCFSKTVPPLSWPWSIDCAGYLDQRSLSETPWWADLLRFEARSLPSSGTWFRSWYTTGSIQDLWLHAASLSSLFSTHTQDFCFRLLSYKLFLFHFITPPKAPHDQRKEHYCCFLGGFFSIWQEKTLLTKRLFEAAI